jgi:hypothetical protein
LPWALLREPPERRRGRRRGLAQAGFTISADVLMNVPL